MALLKAGAEKLGMPRVEGIEFLAGRNVPVLYFGSTKMSGNVSLVDDVASQSGVPSISVSILVKSGDEFVPVATRPRSSQPLSVREAIAALQANQAYYGATGLRLEGGPIMGAVRCYGCEPIRDAAGTLIGSYCISYFVGFT